jgi:uncharacterized Ntn-hydrolase superfamily protein/DNA-binding beta-propeller fold protein YncE
MTLSRCSLALLLALWPVSASATWSIVAMDPQTRQVGAAGASCVEGVVRIAGLVPGKGAVASQASTNLDARDRAVERLEEGLTPDAILQEITGAAFDTMARRRQYGLVAFNGPPVGFTGEGTSPWAGHKTGPNVAVQGNILVSEDVATAALAAFLAPPAGCATRLSDRLMAALEAGASKGGDSRCAFTKAAISAFVMVAGPDDAEPSLHLEALAPSRDPANPVTDLRGQYDRWRQSAPALPCPDAGALRPDAAPRPDGRTEPPEVTGTRPRAGGCAVGGQAQAGWLLVLAWALARRISCRRGPRDATLSTQMRWGWLAATVAVGLGCSLRNLDDLGGGSPPPADATAPADKGGAPDADPIDTTGASGRTLFFVDSGDRGVHSANIDGSGGRSLLTLPMPSYLRSIAIDADEKKIYFTDSGLKKVQRANVDGTEPQDIVTGLDTPVGIDVDAVTAKIYFVDQGAKPTVFRANRDGSAKEAIITTGLLHPYGIVVDGPHNRLFLVDNGNGVQGIFRAGLDGSSLTKLAINGVADPIEIALDRQGGKLYWTELGPPPRVRRANLDGTNAEDIVTQARVPGLSTPLGVAIDVMARKLYWVDGGGGAVDKIYRAELDGSDAHVTVMGLSAPRGLSIAY